MADPACYNESCAYQWKSQLDMDKPCGAVSSEETCWLCHDLMAWNRVMNVLALVLEESRPGMLLLRCSVEKKPDSEQVTAARQASFLASWLLRHHPCVQEVIVSCPESADRPAEEPPVQIHFHSGSSTAPSRRLRGLYISEIPSARLDLKDLDAVVGLETLNIDVDQINERLAVQIDKLMERNCATLKNVDIREFEDTRRGLTMVENLVACESLKLLSNVGKGRIPDIDAMVHLMRISTALKAVNAAKIRQVLSIFSAGMPIREVSALCKALRVNKTLKTVKCLFVDGSDEERTSLARQLLADDCYDRVQLGAWTEPYLSILSPVLASSQSRAEQIVLPDIGELSLESVSATFNALASNKRVNRLDVAVKQDPDARVALLCETLKKNGCMKHFTIVIENVDSGTEILRALAANTAVTFLHITLRMAAIEETTEAFSDMLSRNNAVTSIAVNLYGKGAQQFLDLIAKAMSGNRLIVSFTSRVGYYTYVPSSILESVRRNKCALNRAVEFVLQRRDDRRGGECFELFAGRPCLTTHLIEWRSEEV
ncbi:hypothetical protein HPB52_004110 [Rhipicephalus sanguineus]|uniref:Uncharacterized protein n=1 Tax=Rhipicephalus sanguineus TaxID=34632 RepID=A0A9D4SPB1_RHISA|nr:hypothetical protein HPB52_004110 [Rhipicephalus sanguineus]